MFLLLTIACFPRLPYQLADDAVPDDTGAPDTAADTGQDDTSDSGGQIAIDSVEPHDGPVTGGLEVVITGGGWGDAPAVYFGDTGATLLSVGGDTLTVELPHAPEAGVVDVRIEQGHDSGLAKGGFHYWSDATGKAVFLGAATWLEPGNPDLWADPAPSLSVSAQLIEPLDITYRDLLGAGLESCSQNVVGVDRVDGPDHLETTGAFGTWSVPEDTYAGYYYINDEPTASWSSHATLDLLVPDGGTYPGGGGDVRRQAPAQCGMPDHPHLRRADHRVGRESGGSRWHHRRDLRQGRCGYPRLSQPARSHATGENP